MSWDVPIQADMSWGWRKLLQLRDIVRPFFWVKIGNGYNTSLWHDYWCLSCPLSRYLSPRDITREGYHLQSKVAELIDNGEWVWPHSWVCKAPILGQLTVPVLEGSLVDLPQWRDRNGVFAEFSVAKAWEAIRPRGNMVDWYHVVWFSHGIPRHSFHLWLVMRNSLKTHDMMRQWDVGNTVDLSLLRCALCDSQPDSHAHLFFECTFSSKVWMYVRDLAGMDNISPVLHDIILYLQPMGNKRSARNVFGKLILAASAYFIWLERNNRVFKKIKKSPEDIRDIVMVTVRLKLLSFRFKRTNSVELLLSRWKMPTSFRIYGDV